MILRKPYAFFIKHFRFIHIILMFLLSYSLYRTKMIMDFFNQIIITTVKVTGQDLISAYLYSPIFLIVVFTLILLSLILVVMIVKQKPKTFYIIAIMIYVFTLIIFGITQSTMYTLQETIIDVRVSRLVRDLIMVSFVCQLASTIVVFVRAVGFDIKKFDFKKDLQDLQIEEEDSEEFEVDFEIDKNKTRRKINRTIRFLKYSYKENKLTFNLSIGVVLTAVFVLIGLNFYSESRTLGHNEYFRGNGFNLAIMESYLTNVDYRGKEIGDDYYLIVRLKINSTDGNYKKIDLATTKILIDKFVYLPDLSKNSLLFDFGNVYNNQDIGSDKQVVSLIYSIPKQLIDKNIYFSYVNKVKVVNNNYKNIKVKLNYKKIKEEEKTTYNLNDKKDFKGVLNNYSFSINKVEFSKKFKINYNYTVSNQTYPSYEYLNPTLTGKEDKAILKIEGNFNVGDLRMSGINNLYDFISSFSYLNYVKNNQTFVQKLAFNEVKPKKVNQPNIYYVEILEDVLSSEKVYLSFTVRNEKFDYILK